MGRKVLGALLMTILGGGAVAGPRPAYGQSLSPAPEPVPPAASVAAQAAGAPEQPTMAAVPEAPGATSAPEATASAPGASGKSEPAPPNRAPSEQAASLPAAPPTREEVVRMKARPTGRGGTAAPSTSAAFLEVASPWVDWSMTSFYLDNRAGNFLNLGVQFGGYVWEAFRVSARLITPLENVRDNYAASGYPILTSNHDLKSRSLSVLYGVSAGLVVTNGKSFVLAPSALLLRTDVEDYGSTLAFSLPFEWTSQRHLRVGFEIALGRSFGGSIREVCRELNTGLPCGQGSRDRPSGLSILFQYYMGWSLGHL